MSQWSHVNAIIRFDSLMGIGAPTESELGEISTWEHPVDGTTLPCGSEGSLRYNIWRSPDTNSVASHTVGFWGDLRSYSDVDEILEYFTKITAGKMIRSGILEIDVEGERCSIYRYDSDQSAWICQD